MSHSCHRLGQETWRNHAQRSKLVPRFRLFQCIQIHLRIRWPPPKGDSRCCPPRWQAKIRLEKMVRPALLLAKEGSSIRQLASIFPCAAVPFPIPPFHPWPGLQIGWFGWGYQRTAGIPHNRWNTRQRSVLPSTWAFVGSQNGWRLGWIKTTNPNHERFHRHLNPRNKRSWYWPVLQAASRTWTCRCFHYKSRFLIHLLG